MTPSSTINYKLILIILHDLYLSFPFQLKRDLSVRYFELISSQRDQRNLRRHLKNNSIYCTPSSVDQIRLSVGLFTSLLFWRSKYCQKKKLSKDTSLILVNSFHYFNSFSWDYLPQYCVERNETLHYDPMTSILFSLKCSYNFVN